MEQQMESRYEALLRRYLPEVGDSFSPQEPLSSYGLDSLGTVELMIAIEDEFEVAFPDSLLTSQTFETAASLWSAVALMQRDRGAPDPS